MLLSLCVFLHESQKRCPSINSMAANACCHIPSMLWFVLPHKLSRFPRPSAITIASIAQARYEILGFKDGPCDDRVRTGLRSLVKMSSHRCLGLSCWKSTVGKTVQQIWLLITRVERELLITPFLGR